MEIDLELYRREVLVSPSPVVRLSVIDISPEQPQHTLVFLHGFGGHARQWRYQLQEFSQSNRVIAIDLRGHGRSDRPRTRYDMPEILADLDAVWDHLGLQKPVTLVGHSFGGAVAAEFAQRNPQRVERLVLIATGVKFRLNALYRFGLSLPGPLLNRLGGVIRRQLGAPLPVLQAWYQHNMAIWEGRELFRQLSMPVLVVRGHLDPVLAKPLFDEVARLIPNVDEVDLGAAGHMVMLERRAAVNRAIERFLNSARESWRGWQTEGDGRTQLIQERPWLAHYEEGVPYTIAIPRIPVTGLLDSALRRHPHHAALLFEGSRITYRQLVQEVNRFANALLELGLVKGDRVMLILPNLPQMVMAYFGTLKAGGVAVFTLPSNTTAEWVRQLGDSQARYAVILKQFNGLFEALNDAQPPAQGWSLEYIFTTEVADYLPETRRAALRLAGSALAVTAAKPPQGMVVQEFKSVVEGQEAADPQVELAPDDLAAIIYTGGTTAEPKGVMLSHSNLVANALQARHWIAQAEEGRERFLCVLPFAHSYGLTTALNLPVALAGMLILKARFEIEDILRTIQRYRPTIFPGVPQMYLEIKDYPGIRRYGIDSINACISGAAPLPVEVQEAFEKLTRGRLVEGYGLTEASPITHGNPVNGLRKVGSIGIPLPSTEARVVGLKQSTEPVPIGQIGELAVRGPQVMLGYWRNPQATYQVLDDSGWLLTGDIAQMDPDGYFRIVARKADLWYPSRPDQPAFPRDVEEVLFEIPQVKEAAVVPVAGQPVAFIIARNPLTAESVTAYCKRRLPPEMVPRLVIFVDEFPRTFIGKVLRRELAKVLKTGSEKPTSLELPGSGV
jgi:long-chain acyl-CoA synthetase